MLIAILMQLRDTAVIMGMVTLVGLLFAAVKLKSVVDVFSEL